MNGWLMYEELLIVERIGRYILIAFSLLYFAMGVFTGLLGHSFSMFSNFSFSLIYIYFIFRFDNKGINNLAYTIHFVSILYVVSMVYYFGWDFGAQYFLIPCICFCYVGKFNNKRIIYFLAVVESVIFELLYYFMEYKKYSLANKLVIADSEVNTIFYIYHSFVTCITIILLMYFLKVKTYKTIENKENLNEKLSINASIDPLTSLLNRWAFMEHIQTYKLNSPIHFALIDIDFFKHVNDTYGHSTGDEVLRVCAGCIRQSFSKHTDMMARWGGEEFLIFTSGCSKEEFYQSCEEFRIGISECKFCAIDYKITASIGCLHIDEQFNYLNFDKYIKEVDELLYRAKNTGRNKIISRSV